MNDFWKKERIMKDFDFTNIFIYDMANNHQGDENHALKIIQAMGEVTRDTGVRGALKFQFRQIDTFIHPAFKERTDVKHIPKHDLPNLIIQLQSDMQKAADNLEFEKAILLRDKIKKFTEQLHEG